MRKLIAASAVVAGLMFAAPAHATVYGDVFQKFCNRTDHAGQNMCLGIIVGARDVWGYYEMDQRICLFNMPDGATSEQVYAVVLKFLNANPERWKEPAVGLVLAAFKQAWPCEPGQTKVPTP